jgi:tRNA (Thr-GGU) A37 N-methylase
VNKKEGTMAIVMEPIGIVRGGRAEAVDDAWGLVEADIVLDPARLKPEATLGLTAYSHVVVVFHMHKVAEDKVETGARHPREREDWPLVGILAQPARSRPNRIGVTTAALVSVDGLTVRVRGLDAIDGTPVLDIKPHITGFAPRGVIREPTWVRDLMREYW